MSKTYACLAALPLAVLVSACATTGTQADSAEAQMQDAILAALEPATEEEKEAANRADPLTKANFWSREYQKDPSNLENAIAFATALREMGSHERAVEVGAQTALVHPDNADIMMITGRALVSSGNLAGATQAFNRVITINPQHADGWAALGATLDQLGRHNDAQRAYTEALKLEPARTKTLANYGLSLALTGNLEGAETKLRQAAAAPDATIKVRENLALVLGLQGKFEDMRVASGPYAPKDIIEQNIALLEAMKAPVRSWEALMEEAEAEIAAYRPEMTAEVPDAATTQPVETEAIADPGAEAKPPKAEKAPEPGGFSLRGKQ